MNEYVSHPSPLALWDPGGAVPYFELFGDSSPVISPEPTFTLPAGPTQQEEPHADVSLPLYEYFWTIGLPDDPQHPMGPLAPFLHHPAREGADVWLYFPLAGGWRVCEVVATVRVLKPLPHQDKLLEKVASYWTVMNPIVDDARKVVGMANSLMPPNPVTPTAARLLTTLASLRFTSLPPVEGYAWSITKVTCRIEGEVMEGVRCKVVPVVKTTDRGVIS